MSDNDQQVPARLSHVPTAIPEVQAGVVAVRSDDAGESLAETAQRVHRALRGRYLWVIALGVCGAAIGALAGWRRAPLRFKSEGLVQIAYTLPQVFQETDQNRPMAMYDAFMASQKLLITSRRTVDLAMQQPAWKATGLGDSPPVLADFTDSMDVLVNPQTQYIRITYSDRNPAIAAAGARALVAAYAQLYNSRDQRIEQQVVDAAKQLSTSMSGRIDQLNKQIEAIASEYGSTNFDPLYESAVQRVTRLQAAQTDLQLAIARAPATAPSVADELAVQSYGTEGGFLQRYYEAMVTAQTDLDTLTLKYAENHPAIQNARKTADMAKTRFDNYVQKFQASSAPGAAGASTLVPNRESLKPEVAEVEKLMQQAKTEMVTLGQKRFNIQQLLKTRDETREELVKVNQRIDTLQAESAVGGRLSIVSDGEVPLQPARDLRLPIAAGVGLLGALAPAALLLIWNVVRSRCRYSDDAQAAVGHDVTLLGTLPDLREDDTQQDAMAAQSVHQIRVSLQSGRPTQESIAYLVTSAGPGDGKTSLSLALGLSFAASGMRTLVIDFDLAGRRLSRSLRNSTLVGLPEALAAGHVNGYVQEFGGLSVLTTGSATSLDASAIGAAFLRRLMISTRKEYAVVLIDTGPILGSVEATLAAREVDGTILAVTAGQQHALVRRALVLLKSLGASRMGIVFNRADSKDFYRSAYVSARSTSDEGEPQTNSPPTPCPFGPLVRAVLGSLSKASPLTLH